MLLMTLGYIPMLSDELSAHGSKKEVIEAAVKLMGLKLSPSRLESIKHVKELQSKKYRVKAKTQSTMGGILADQTGLGKTIQTLAFISWMTKNHITENNNKPALVSCPPMLVESWANEAHTKFPELLIGVMYSEVGKFANPELASREIPAKFTNKLPSMEGMPAALRPAFSDSKTRNRWVIVASTDTFMSRVVKTVPDKTRDKIIVERIDKTDGIMKKFKVRPMIYEHKMKGYFSITFSDEGHRLRNHNSKAHFAIRGAKAPNNWIITATPMISAVSHSWTSPEYPFLRLPRASFPLDADCVCYIGKRFPWSCESTVQTTLRDPTV